MFEPPSTEQELMDEPSTGQRAAIISQHTGQRSLNYSCLMQAAKPSGDKLNKKDQEMMKAFEKCEEVVKMLEVLTAHHDVRWERIGAAEYKVPIARNFVALEYRKDDDMTPCVKLKLYGEQGEKRDEMVFRHGEKGYRELKRLYDSAKNSLGE